MLASAKSWSSPASQKTGTTGRPHCSLQDGGKRRSAEGLVDGVERPGEEPRLLAGGDGERAGAAEPGEQRVPCGRRQEGGGERVDGLGPRALACRGRLERVLERRGDEAKAHAVCPSRIVRGESAPSGDAS